MDPQYMSAIRNSQGDGREGAEQALAWVRLSENPADKTLSGSADKDWTS
jgi:hypothetical protein